MEGSTFSQYIGYITFPEHSQRRLTMMLQNIYNMQYWEGKDWQIALKAEIAVCVDTSKMLYCFRSIRVLSLLCTAEIHRKKCNLTYVLC